MKFPAVANNPLIGATSALNFSVPLFAKFKYLIHI